MHEISFLVIPFSSLFFKCSISNVMDVTEGDAIKEHFSDEVTSESSNEDSRSDISENSNREISMTNEY